jgi:hypothetical protein
VSYYEICLRQNAIYNNAASSLARAWLEARQQPDPAYCRDLTGVNNRTALFHGSAT